MDAWRDELLPEDRARLERLEAAGGSLRWQVDAAAVPAEHSVYGIAHGIPIVGAGPIYAPLDPAQVRKAVHDVIERVATVLGVLEG